MFPNISPRVFNSFTELAAAQGDFIPAHGEKRPESVQSGTDNSIAGAVAAIGGMDDARLVYGAAVSAVGMPGSEGLMHDDQVHAARVKLEDGTNEAASELTEADRNNEFVPSGTSDFSEGMAMVHDVNRAVQGAVKQLGRAERKLDIPLPQDVRESAVTVDSYAKKASEQNPSRFTEKRKNQDQLDQIGKGLERQKRARAEY